MRRASKRGVLGKFQQRAIKAWRVKRAKAWEADVNAYHEEKMRQHMEQVAMRCNDRDFLDEVLQHWEQTQMEAADFARVVWLESLVE